jgi:hypothetical protein
MNPNASSTLGTRSPRGFVPRVVFCVGAYGLDSSILLGSTLSTNGTRHPVAASNVSKSQSTQSATWVHVIVRPYSFTLTDNLVELCPCQQYPGLSF